MHQSVGLVLSILFHVLLAVFALYWVNGQDVRVNMDRPVYTVDLVSLAPPPPGPVPVVEATPEPVAETAEVPVVEAKPEPVVEPVTPIVEAKPEPEVEKISEKKVEKKKIVKKKEDKPKPEPKPEPKPKPKKTAAQLRKEALAAAKAQVKKDEKKKKRALAKELANLKKAKSDVYSHGGQPGGVEGGQVGGTVGGTGSGLSEVYALIVGTSIKKNWRYPSFSGESNLLVTVEIALDKQGKILSSKVIESSNNPEFDNSALRAIKETEYVEKPRTDRDRILRINFNSQELSE